MNTDIYSRILIAVVLLSATFAEPLLLAQQSTSNYVMKTTHINPDSTAYARQEIRYHDGLGRPVQLLRRHAATNADDLVDLTEYDSLGRVSRTWNPIAIWAAGGQVSAASLASGAQSYYDDECPFSETLYDGSPLDRVRKVTGPGEAWHLAGKGVKSNYYTNAESVGTDSLHCIRFGFSLSGNTGITFTRDNLWPSGSLTVDRTEDEDGRTLWVFKDMRDLVVLERRLAEAATNSAGAVYADTYYLYDDAGRLTAVLPPELSAYFGWGNWPGISETAPKVEGFAFQYRYDARGRMIAKKLPGAAWTYYVYDKGDRLVLTQDGNQRERGEWSFRLQDALGRECLTGTMAGSYDAFADPLGSVQVRAIRNHGDGDYGSLHDYSVEGLSLPADAEALTVNWWDDYSFLGHESGMGGSLYGYTAPAATEPYSARYETSAAGLQTGHWNRTLGEVRQNVGPAVMEAWYYDDHGRVVYHVKGYPSGRRVQERSGYDFVGNLTALGRTMYDGAGVEEHTEAYAYQYDNWGRLQNTTHTLDGGTPVTLTNNTYDSVGRLNGTTRGAIGATPGPASLSSSYAYNVRDWLTEINCPLFSETLAYETPRTGSTLPGQWSGNISSSQWRTSASSSDWKWYDYAYDMMGRLTEARFGEAAVVSAVDYNLAYEYDLNGNLERRTSLNNAGALPNHERETRWIWSQADGNRSAGWVQRQFDVTILSGTIPRPPQRLYQIDVSGNQDESYAYDSNGNRTATLDTQGDTLRVTRYNLLNLPEEYVGAQGDTVRYVYSAEGEKLFVQEKQHAGAAQGTENAANYRIENGAVTMIHTDAGYYTSVVLPPGASGPLFVHLWYLKDHLGNNRVLADGSGNAVAFHDYDPYGEEIAVASSSLPYPLPPGAKDSPYLYGGKEWSETTSTYDFEARYLSPSFHRFTTMDPLAEKYYSISPYAYCAGDPVNRVDLEGMDWYYYLDDGRKHYHYEEGQLSEKEMKENGYTYVGKTALEGDTYYSLFGKTISMSQSNLEGELYQAIDELIMNYIESVQWTPSNPFDQDIPSSRTDFSRVKSVKPFAFVYEGSGFTSESDGTMFSPISSSTFRGQVIKGDSMLILRRFPSDNNMGYGGPAPTGNMMFWRDGRWLIGESSQKRGHPLQIRFNDQNAAKFLQAVNNLFHTSFSL